MNLRYQNRIIKGALFFKTTNRLMIIEDNGRLNNYNVIPIISESENWGRSLMDIDYCKSVFFSEKHKIVIWEIKDKPMIVQFFSR